MFLNLLLPFLLFSCENITISAFEFLLFTLFLFGGKNFSIFEYLAKNEVYFSVKINIYLVILVSSKEKNTTEKIMHNAINVVIAIPPMDLVKYLRIYL